MICLFGNQTTNLPLKNAPFVLGEYVDVVSVAVVVVVVVVVVVATAVSFIVQNNLL